MEPTTGAGYNLASSIPTYKFGELKLDNPKENHTRRNREFSYSEPPVNLQ